MNITPITKKYTNPYNTSAISFGSKGVAERNAEKTFSCPKTIVKSTLNEFSNSRGNYLVDIDLTDIFISDAKKAYSKVTKEANSKLNVQNTPKTDAKHINFLADMPLCDIYELPVKKQDKNLQLPFGGAYPQYLIDQDAVEQYESTSNGIKDIANSTYCSFGNSPSERVVDKVVSIVKKLSSKISF